MQWFLMRLKLFDWWLMASSLLLMLMGLLVLWSMSVGASAQGGDSIAQTRFFHQSLYAVAGIAIIVVGAALLDMRTIEHGSIPVFIITVLLLGAVLVSGSVVRGTKGWFVWQSLNLQPVEFAKVGFILFFAALLKRWARRLKELRALMLTATAMMVVGGLVLLQPDFGSFFIFLAVWVAMVLTIGLKRSHVVTMLLLTVVLSVVAWQLFAPYQRDRLLVFLNPNIDPLGRGYQLRQAMIAVGSGQWLGKGLGAGSQNQLQFLPERQTDFLFAVIAEEMGFIGAGLVIVLWAVVLLRLLYWSSVVQDDFALFALVGLAILLFVEISVVIGMNVGLFPITGLSLPLLSYGGSSFIATAMALMIAQSIIIEAKRSGWVRKYQ
ncbi:FtsW/RodA/SpoVE family cell cycle protein [Candidatus Uhrbacteria bacterium]|nr:FtsW/RodA/SpoVE family cell cycle protein [Candidatus Uhrbacteria bacterium]